jgi:ketosteroid isomerase-like protein
MWNGTREDHASVAEAVAHRYYRTVSELSSTEDQLRALLAPDVRVVEHPNALVPGGAVRDLDQTLAGFARGKALLREQSFDVLEIVSSGERVAVRATWRGVIGADAGPFHAGQQLTAHVAAWLTVRDGRVVEHETFDCYEPFTRAE